MPGFTSSSLMTGLATAFVVGGTVGDDIGDVISAYLYTDPSQRDGPRCKGLLARLREYINNRKATDPRGKLFTIPISRISAPREETVKKVKEITQSDTSLIQGAKEWISEHKKGLAGVVGGYIGIGIISSIFPIVGTILSALPALTIGMVNSESRLLGNLVKKDRIDFTSEIVEKVYEFLPLEQKYIMDEVGNVWQLDPIGVVRSALEIMDYQLDPAWYAWGTEAPKVIDKVKIAEKINWNEAQKFFFSTDYNSKYIKLDKDQRITIINRILGLEKIADANQRIQRFNELSAEQWHKNVHQNILQNLRETLGELIDSEFTLAIATYITKDGTIKHIISINGITNGQSKFWRDISDRIKNIYKSDDIIIAYSPDDKRFFITPSFTSILPRDNHAEVKIFEKLMSDDLAADIAPKSKVLLSTDRFMCVTCRMTIEQFIILNEINRKFITIEFYDGKELRKTDFKKHFPGTENWNENNFKNIYRDFFEKYRIQNYEIILEQLWETYKNEIYYNNPGNYLGEQK